MDRSVTILHILTHEYVTPSGADEIKGIGTYSTRENAMAALRRVRDKPGFCDMPDNFRIREIVVDRDHWTSGFGPTSGSFLDDGVA